MTKRTGEVNLQKKPNNRGSFYSRHKEAAVAVAASLAIGSVFGGYAYMQTKDGENATRIMREVPPLTKKVGFTSDVYGAWTSNDSVRGEIRINKNCSLTDVTMDIKQKNGHVVDVTGYHIDGVAYPHVEHRYNGVAPHTTVEGADNTLDFKDKEDLEKNILHATDGFACQALAKAMEFQQNPNDLPTPSAAN